MNLWGFKQLKYFINTKVLPSYAHKHVDDYVRCITLLIISSLISVGKGVSFVQFIIVGITTGQVYFGVLCALGGFWLLMVCIPFVLRRTHSFYMMSHYVIFVLYLGTLLSFSTTTGFMIINCTLFPLLPLLACFMLSSVYGVLFWYSVFVFTAAIMYYTRPEGDWPSITQLRELTFVAMILNLSCTAIIGGLFGVMSSIKQKELESERDKAKELSKVKSEFTANVSHEIRTPLVAVIGLSELLTKDSTLTSEHRYLMDTIYSASVHLDNLVNNVLNFSKMDSNALQLEETIFDVADLVEETAAYFSSVAENSTVRLLTFIDPKSIQGRNVVVGDPHRIQQILQNLIGNAIKFSKSDVKEGEVLVTLDTIPFIPRKTEQYPEIQDEMKGSFGFSEPDVNHVPVPKTSPNVGSDGRAYRFIVSDNGIGMSEAGIKKLFLPFSQCDSSTTRKYGGTGLGLVICKQLCNLMGGDIFVESREGFGTSITFVIPLMTSSEQNINTTGMYGASQKTVIKNRLKNLVKIDLKSSNDNFLGSSAELENNSSTAEPTPKSPRKQSTQTYSPTQQHSPRKQTTTQVTAQPYSPTAKQHQQPSSPTKPTVQQLNPIPTIPTTPPHSPTLQLGPLLPTQPLIHQKPTLQQTQIIHQPTLQTQQQTQQQTQHNPIPNTPPRKLARMGPRKSIQTKLAYVKKGLAKSGVANLDKVEKLFNSESPSTPPQLQASQQSNLEPDYWKRASEELKNIKIGIICDSKFMGRVLKDYLTFNGIFNVKIMNFEEYVEYKNMITNRVINKPPKARGKSKKTRRKFDIIIADCKPFKLQNLEVNSDDLENMLNMELVSSRLCTNYIFLVSWKCKKMGKIFDLPQNITINFCAKDPIKRKDLARAMITCYDKQVLTQVSERNASPEPDKKHLKILLCEDNLVNVEVIMRQLRRLGYEADVVNNGQEAVNAFSRTKYDVILMDCQMPVLDGYGATEKIREMEAAQAAEPVLIVALTASAMPEERERGLKAGMNRYLSKPIHLDVLRDLLQT